MSDRTNDLGLVPQVQQITMRPGQYRLRPGGQMVHRGPGAGDAAALLSEYLATGFVQPVAACETGTEPPEAISRLSANGCGGTAAGSKRWDAIMAAGLMNAKP